jgi:hypothetical protein
MLEYLSKVRFPEPLNPEKAVVESLVTLMDQSKDLLFFKS